MFTILTEMGISVKDLSEGTEIEEQLLLQKIRGEKSWKLSEAIKVCCYLKNPNITKLFVQLDSNS